MKLKAGAGPTVLLSRGRQLAPLVISFFLLIVLNRSVIDFDALKKLRLANKKAARQEGTRKLEAATQLLQLWYNDTYAPQISTLGTKELKALREAKANEVGLTESQIKHKINGWKKTLSATSSSSSSSSSLTPSQASSSSSSLSTFPGASSSSFSLSTLSSTASSSSSFLMPSQASSSSSSLSTFPGASSSSFSLSTLSSTASSSSSFLMPSQASSSSSLSLAATTRTAKNKTKGDHPGTVNKRHKASAATPLAVSPESGASEQSHPVIIFFQTTNL